MALVMVLVVTPALFPLNMLISRLIAGWLPPVQFTFWRWLFTAIFAGLLVLPQVRTSLPIIRREWLRLLILGAIGMSLCGVSAYEAGHTTSTANIALIYASSPVMMVALEWMFGKARLVWAQSAGIVLCLLGVMAIITRGDAGMLARMNFVAGDLWALSGAVGWALYSYLLRHMRTELPFAVRLPALCATGTVAVAPFALIEWSSGVELVWSIQAVGMLTLTVVVASYLSYVAYAKLQRMTSVAFAGLAVYVAPVYAALYGWLFVNEALSGYHLIGAAMILAGIWLASRQVAPAREAAA
jgi:drug/metabolite transporter (DMT)-like permease